MKNETALKRFGWQLSILGAIGFAAAFVLTIEKIHLLMDPSYVPSCSINPVLACGSIMQTPQASAFGFANSLLGIAGFAVVTTIGMALVAGGRFQRWFWLGLQTGTIFGIGFVHWLMYQSIIVINALCPYCMIVWAVMIPLFVLVTKYNLEHKNIVFKGSPAVSSWLNRHWPKVIIGWYFIVALDIGYKFWDYWQTLI